MNYSEQVSVLKPAVQIKKPGSMLHEGPDRRKGVSEDSNYGAHVRVMASGLKEEGKWEALA